ncbi:MAG: tetratricopeptide repeat protein [Balneolales bacterium]
MNVKNYEAAMVLMREEIEKEPYNPEYHLLLGEAYLQLGEYEQARASFDNSSYTNSEYNEHIQLLMEKHYREEYKAGVRALQKERYKDSLHHFLKAAEIKPDSHELYPVLGFSYYKLDNLSKAYESYSMAIELDESDAESLHALSELAFGFGEFSDAAAYARQVTDLDKEFIPAYEMLFYTNIKLEDYERAEQAYQSIPEEQRSINLLTNYAISLFNQEKYDEALPFIEELYNINPDNENISQTLAETYYHLKHYEKMAVIYETLYQHKPHDTDILVNLIEAYELTGNQDSAEDYRGRLQNLLSDS